MAEIHIIGRIDSASDFPDSRLFCRWEMQLGGGWRLLSGFKEGQTQTDLPEIDDIAHFCHPVDIHLATKTIQGWPKLSVQIWHEDTMGRQELYGYGSTHVPVSPGEHRLCIHTWRPIGGSRDEFLRRFIGGGLQLRSLSSIDNNENRLRIRTVAMGKVNITLGLILRNFDKFGIIS